MFECIECNYSKNNDINLGTEKWWPNKILLNCIKCGNKICNNCLKKENGCLCKYYVRRNKKCHIVLVIT